jgi:hypothetical protein
MDRVDARMDSSTAAGDVGGIFSAAFALYREMETWASLTSE